MCVNVTDMDITRAREDGFKAHYRQTDITRQPIVIIWESIGSMPCLTGMVDKLKVVAAVSAVEEWLRAMESSKRDIASGMDELLHDL